MPDGFRGLRPKAAVERMAGARRGRAVLHKTHAACCKGCLRMAQKAQGNDSVQRIAAFSKGIYSLHEQNGRVLLTDLRMGQEPAYVFRFDVGASHAVGAQAPVQLAMRPDLRRGLPWLWDRIWGLDAPMPIATAAPAAPI